MPMGYIFKNENAIAVIDGHYVDTYDSGDRNVLFYYQKDF